MPGFGSPFSGLANDRKLTDEELIASQVAAALDTDRAERRRAPNLHGRASCIPPAPTLGAQKRSKRQSTQKKAVRKEALHAHERGKSKFNDERSSPGPNLVEGNRATDFSGQGSIIFQTLQLC